MRAASVLPFRSTLSVYPMRLLFALPVVIIATALQAPICTADLETVVEQVGGSVLFRGTPTAAHAAGMEGGPLHLDFGGDYPDNTFSMVLFADTAAAVQAALLQRPTGKEVRVQGMVSR